MILRSLSYTIGQLILSQIEQGTRKGADLLEWVILNLVEITFSKSSIDIFFSGYQRSSHLHCVEHHQSSIAFLKNVSQFFLSVNSSSWYLDWNPRKCCTGSNIWKMRLLMLLKSQCHKFQYTGGRSCGTALNSCHCAQPEPGVASKSLDGAL